MNELPSILMAVKIFHEVCTHGIQGIVHCDCQSLDLTRSIRAGMYLEHVAELCV